MKTRYTLAGILLSALAIQAQTVTIKNSAGWLESAHVEWTVSGKADSYNVYVTGGGLTNQKLDNPLIRYYGSYWRADAPGLKAGSYTLKVVPVVAGAEKTAATTAALTVLAHDRAGFAFSGGRIPGAYNLDGTPKTGAVVLYVTDKTKDTVSMTVTGASANPCKGIQTILDAYKKGKETRPLIIRLVGQVKDPTYLLAGDMVIENTNLATGHLTLEGVGNDATVDGWGIRVKNASNIEIRNLGIMNVNSSEGDNIGLQQANDHIWVHNNDFFYGDAGGDADQAKGDGSLDCKKSTWVTFSYNRFWDNGKVNLLGLSEGTMADLYITYHHNWYDHSDSRHPRVRYYSAHVYNNYYDGNSKYGTGSTLGSSVFMEGNYFRNCKYPMLTSMQGSDVWDPVKKANDYANMGTFSGEDGGTIKAWNNKFDSSEGAPKRFVAYGATGGDIVNSTTEFDAYVVKSRTETVPATVKSAYGANVYNNFDVNTSVMYAYTADQPDAAKAKVMTYAGRIQNGDFKWTYNNAKDDTASAVNPAMKAALVGYKTTLAYIQGEGTAPVSIATKNQSLQNPIRFDLQAHRLSVSQGWTLLSAELFATNGSRVLAAHGSSAVSLDGLKAGVYLARVVTDRGAFEKMVLKN